MSTAKDEFFRLAAKRFATSTVLYKVDSVVHVEDQDDIWFWRQILSRFRPGSYKFLKGSLNEHNRFTTGCTQCLKYRDSLCQRFFICIDSDLRYLLDEDISAQKGILQTYTYSWENHCCFAEALQQRFEEHMGDDAIFDFSIFLHEYSEILYRPFLFMLYCERNGLEVFDRNKFKELISLQYRTGDEIDNGRPLLDRLAKSLRENVEDLIVAQDIDFDEEAARYSVKGLTAENVYLFVRGHSLYNLLNSIGRQICNGSGVDFEQNILRSALAFDRYESISLIKRDISILKTIRRTI